MRVKTRKQENASEFPVALRGRKRPMDAPNSLKFLTYIEGVEEFDGRVRGANGIKWRIA